MFFQVPVKRSISKHSISSSKLCQRKSKKQTKKIQYITTIVLCKGNLYNSYTYTFHRTFSEYIINEYFNGFEAIFLVRKTII